MDIVSSNYLASDWEYLCAEVLPGECPVNFAGTVDVIPCTPTEDGPRFNCDAETNRCLTFYISNTSELNGIIVEYNTLVADSQKNTIQAQELYGSIIRGFNTLNDRIGLQAFLEGENDNEANKLLIPLYIETEQYSLAENAIANLIVSPEEHAAYEEYYEIIMNLQVEGRRIDDLYPHEFEKVTEIANDTLEVSPFAKSLLAMGYDEKWIHPVDENLEEMMVYSSQTQLGLSEIEKAPNWIKAIPNPASQMVTIQAQIENLQNTAQVVLRNIAGRTIVTESLKAGYNEVTIDLKNIESGMYIYSLISNGRVIESKLLSVIK